MRGSFINILCLVKSFVYLTSGATEDYGEPLFLSTLLDAGNVEEAQNLSRVSPDIGNMTSYSGFLTVDKECESFLFFWFVPAQEGDWKSAPVVLWQQGGPGTTNFFAMFLELGPFEYTKDGGLTKRKFAWNTKNNLLFIDNPPGVGFSFTRKNCYPTNVTEVGTIFFSGLMEFYRLFPGLLGNKLILCGESYAGKYVPVLAHNIHQNNLSGGSKVNLTCILLSGTFTDPLTQTPYESDLFYQLGMIDELQKEQFMLYENLCFAAIRAQNWKKALYYCNPITGTFFYVFIGTDVNIYNFDRGTTFDETSYIDFLELPSTRKALHVGKLLFVAESAKVQNKLKYDTYQSVKSYVEELLPFYPFIFMNGQNDLICPYVLGRKFWLSLNWSYQSEYKEATRFQWCEQNDVAGYFKGVNNLYDILVRSCGHYVPREQGELGYIIINSVCEGSPLTPLQGLTNCDYA